MISREELPPSDTPSSPPSDPVRTMGPFEVIRDHAQLTLRLPNKGELGLKGCLLLAFTMVFILAMGILMVLQVADTGAPGAIGADDPAVLFAPTHNHFGFLWLVSCLVLFGGVPWYVVRAYRSALTFTFRRLDDAVLRDGRLITRMRRIEYVSIRESHDPDGAYLYLLHLFYGDGRSLLLHNGYNEREIMNLANEVASFIDTRVVFR